MSETKQLFGSYNKKEINFLKIIAIEPNPILVKRIKDNVSLLENNIPEITDKIIIENYAIGLEKKEIFLDLDEGYGNARVKIFL